MLMPFSHINFSLYRMIFVKVSTLLLVLESHTKKKNKYLLNFRRNKIDCLLFFSRASSLEIKHQVGFLKTVSYSVLNKNIFVRNTY